MCLADVNMSGWVHCRSHVVQTTEEAYKSRQTSRHTWQFFCFWYCARVEDKRRSNPLWVASKKFSSLRILISNLKHENNYVQGFVTKFSCSSWNNDDVLLLLLVNPRLQICCSIRYPTNVADSWIQEAQLSPSDGAMRRVSSNLANYHATVLKLLIGLRQVLTKSMAWSWRFSWRKCVINKPTTVELCISPVYRRLAVAKFSKSTM